MRRPDRPPDMDFFRDERPSHGGQTLGLRLGDVGVRLDGLATELAEILAKTYGPFATRELTGERVLRVRVGREDTDYFIDPPETIEPNPVLLECDGTRIRYLGHRVAGWFDTLGGEGRLLLASGEYERAEGAIENYVRAAVAWQAASRGGALVHAASAVLRGLAFLFFGPSGAGKSTLSACNRRARVVSDDLTLVLPGDGGEARVVGSPFRGTWTGGEPVVGSFPLRAGFRLVQARVPEVRTVPRVRAFGELVGNLPFVAEEFHARPDLFESVERAFAAVPLHHLRFRKDDSYWDAIEAAGLLETGGRDR